MALESLLHQIIISAAIKGNTGTMSPDGTGGIGSICLILDDLKTFVPSIFSRVGGGNGDLSLPALNANGV